MRLNDTVIHPAKPGPKPFKLFNGGGLYLLVNPNGSRWWKMKYYFEGVEKLRSIGYPDVSRTRRGCARCSAAPDALTDLLVPRLADALHRARRLAAAPYRGGTWLVVAIAAGALSALVGRVVAPRKAAASGRRSESQPLPPLAHALQRFTIVSTSISDRSTFRGTEHAASPLIYG
jgi:hypothetical protein